MTKLITQFLILILSENYILGENDTTCTPSHDARAGAVYSTKCLSIGVPGLSRDFLKYVENHVRSCPAKGCDNIIPISRKRLFYSGWIDCIDFYDVADNWQKCFYEIPDHSTDSPELDHWVESMKKLAWFQGTNSRGTSYVKQVMIKDFQKNSPELNIDTLDKICQQIHPGAFLAEGTGAFVEEICLSNKNNFGCLIRTEVNKLKIIKHPSKLNVKLENYQISRILCEIIICPTGYHFNQFHKRCIVNVCECMNGTPAAALDHSEVPSHALDIECPSHGETFCKSCDVGYHLDHRGVYRTKFSAYILTC